MLIQSLLLVRWYRPTKKFAGLDIFIIRAGNTLLQKPIQKLTGALILEIQVNGVLTVMILRIGGRSMGT
jgi:hypothetical protein